MHYIDEFTNKVYVEVKTSTGAEGDFYISSNELAFAEHNGSNYEIINAANINNDAKKFYSYKGLFLYGEGDTRYHNKKFKLDAKEYRIQAKKLEEGD
jgi:hypothetical protein